MKSVEIKFNEALEALRKAGKLETFNEKSAQSATIETKLNLAEAILKESRVIRKHNGAADNGGQTFSEGFVKEPDPREALLKSYIATGVSEAEARKIVGLPKSKAEQLKLNPIEFRQFSAYLAGGMKEAEALLMAAPQYKTSLTKAVQRGQSVQQFLESLQ
jgi:hypothetical protein